MENKTYNISRPLLNGAKEPLGTVVDVTVTELGAGQHFVLVNAENTLGSSFVTNYTFEFTSSHNNKKKSSYASKIAAGVLVPLAIIIIAIIAGVAIFYFWKKKKHTRGFAKLQTDGDFDDASKGYGTST